MGDNHGPTLFLRPQMMGVPKAATLKCMNHAPLQSLGLHARPFIGFFSGIRWGVSFLRGPLLCGVKEKPKANPPFWGVPKKTHPLEEATILVTPVPSRMESL